MRGKAECGQKRRPQSLVLMPWTTTEAPFILRYSSVKRPRSLPDITRSDFPDPSVEGAVDQGIEPENIDPDFSTEERSDLAMEGMEPTSKKLGFLERFPSSTQEQTSDEVEAVPTSNGKATEPTLVSPSPRDGGHTGAIGLACTSDFPVPPSSRPLPKRNVSQDSHVIPVPRTVEQQRYDRFPPSSRRPSELIENRHVSTFQEQRSADRRPSATTLNEFLDHAVASDDDSSIANSQRDFRGGRLTPGGTNYIASDYFTHSKQASSASSKYSQHSHLSDRKLGQLTLIQPPCSTTSLPIGNNMRAWTPPQTPNKTRRSLSFGMIPRPVTAHSGTSQSSTKLKSFIPWPMENVKTKVPESDDDSRSSLHSERMSTKLASLDDKERSFEELISSGDTIHCTITPDPLRRMEVRDEMINMFDWMLIV